MRPGDGVEFFQFGDPVGEVLPDRLALPADRGAEPDPFADLRLGRQCGVAADGCLEQVGDVAAQGLVAAGEPEEQGGVVEFFLGFVAGGEGAAAELAAFPGGGGGSSSWYHQVPWSELQPPFGRRSLGQLPL